MSDKPFKTIDQQLELLKSRGLLIPDAEEAKSFLLRNNYYRISGYSLTLRDHDHFFEGTTFKNIMDIYMFDRDLRHILLSYLDIIEVTFKSIYAYEFSKLYGPMGYLDEKNFTDPTRFHSTINKVEDQKNKRLPNEAYLKHFINDLHENIPFWAYIDLFTISNASILYSISEPDLQDNVVHHYPFANSKKAGVILGSAMKSMTIIRNLSAHESRLFNRLFDQRPNLNRKDKQLLIIKSDGLPDNSHLYGFILLMRQLLLPDEFKSLKEEIVATHKKYPFVRMDFYGFRNDWEKKL